MSNKAQTINSSGKVLNKGSNSSKITLVEEDNIISDEEEIANIMNNYFVNVAKTLDLYQQLGVS